MILQSWRLAPIVAYLLVCPAYGQNETVWTVNPRILDCSPKILKSDQALVVKMGQRHGRELAIRRVADGKWYFLVVQSPPPEMRPIMTPAQFEAAKRLELSADIAGLEWSANGKEERIFTNPGRYEVYSSTALESEEGGFRCTVNYRG